jgi:hypothetical protein
MIDSFTINVRSSDEMESNKDCPMIEPRRFPPPWSVDELEACFVVKDDAGQKLAYVYYEEEPGRDRRPNCSPKMRREGLQRISPSCPSCYRARCDAMWSDLVR